MSASGPTDPDGDPFGEMAEAFARFLGSFSAGGGGMRFDQARQMAATIANDGRPEPNVDPLERGNLEQLARVAELQVAEATGLVVGDAARVEPVTRTQWTSATLDAYRPLFERLTESLGTIMRQQLDEISPEDLAELGGAMGPLGADPSSFLAGMSQLLGPMMLSMMAGSTVGHLGRRAFGSHDLPIPRPPGPVMIVLDNVDSFSRDWSLPVEDVRLWICLSEMTHAVVLGVPHVGGRLADLLARHAGGFQADPAGLEERLGGIDPGTEEGIVELQRLLADPDVVLGAIRSADQQRIVGEIAELVAVIEGYVDWVVDHVGARLLSSGGMVSEALRRRRVETDQASRFIERLFGLELTRECIDRGTAFVGGVVERAGPGALETLWSSPETLPTPSELEAPGLWLARVGIDGDQPLPEPDDLPEIPDFPDLDH